MKYILSFDLGTGGTKASLFDETGVSVCKTFAICDTLYPRDAYHEQRPEEWWKAVVESARELMEKSGVAPGDVACLAVSGHSLGVVPVDREGSLLTPATPIWSDMRAARQAEAFFRFVPENEWYLDTGNGFPAACYAIFKIMWLMEQAPDIYRRTYCFLGTKDYVNLRLTGKMATDHSDASGSGAYRLTERRYRREYLAAAGVDGGKLPPILESSDVVGTLTKNAAALMGLLEGTPVAAGGVDNACMCLGAACVGEGESYTSLGSSAWVAVSSHRPVVDVRRRPYVFAHCIPGMYVSAASIFAAGSSLRWLKNTLFSSLEERARLENRDVYDMMTELASSAPAGSHRLIFNPSLAGGSGLDKSHNIRGCYTGLALRHTEADVIRATLEGICLNLRMAMDTLAACVPLSGDMLIVGGGGKSPLWRSLFASIYNKRILETNVGQDAGALGAAATAAVAVGLWPSYLQIRGAHHLQGAILPNKRENEQYEAILPVFRKIADMQADIGDMLCALSTDAL